MPARNGSNLSSSSTSRPRPSGNDDHRNLLSTDGSPECWSPDGQDMVSDEKLQEVFVANAHLPAEEIKNAILAAVEQFNPTGEWNDDVSLCVIKMR